MKLENKKSCWLERKYNKKFEDVYEALKYLLEKDKLIIDQKNRQRIGFKANKEGNTVSK